MDNFILDKTNSQTFQLSNDAFFYLFAGEEPLDEANIDEANEIASMFPNGYYIDAWSKVDNSDLIEAVFIPYSQTTNSIDYDAYIELTKYIKVLIKWLDTEHIKVWWLNEPTGEIRALGDCKVYIKNNNRYFHTGPQDEEFTPGKNMQLCIDNFKEKSCPV